MEVYSKWLSDEDKKFEDKGAYFHFDERPNPRHYINYLSVPKNIASHPYMPFLLQRKPKIRYKLNPETGERKIEKKYRELYKCCHKDSLIYSYYNHVISALYEEYLHRQDYSQAVLAYRKFPKGLCNIHFSKMLFEEILKRDECEVICFDIENFFPTLDHEKLKEKWMRLLDVDNGRLPDDHFSVYKALTSYSYIDIKHLAPTIKRQKGKKRRAIFNTIEDFRVYMKRNPHHVKQNESQKGIVQGSAISALLSNMYMLDFDCEAHKMIRSFGGTYLRYSDDIAIVIPSENSSFVKSSMEALFKNSQLTIHKGKTEVLEFLKENGQIKCIQNNLPSRVQYLGFQFDGKKVSVRDKSLANFYRRLSWKIKATVKYAKKKNAIGDTKVMVRHLLRRFTDVKVKPPTNLTSREKKKGKSSFLKYIKRAQIEFEKNELFDVKIESQLKKHQDVFRRKLKKAIEKEFKAFID